MEKKNIWYLIFLLYRPPLLLSIQCTNPHDTQCISSQSKIKRSYLPNRNRSSLELRHSINMAMIPCSTSAPTSAPASRQQCSAARFAVATVSEPSSDLWPTPHLQRAGSHTAPRLPRLTSLMWTGYVSELTGITGNCAIDESIFWLSTHTPCKTKNRWASWPESVIIRFLQQSLLCSSSWLPQCQSRRAATLKVAMWSLSSGDREGQRTWAVQRPASVRGKRLGGRGRRGRSTNTG